MKKSTIVFVAGLAVMFISYFLPYAHMAEKSEKNYRGESVVYQESATHIFLSTAAVKDEPKDYKEMQDYSKDDAASAMLASNVMPDKKLRPLDLILSLFIPILSASLIATAVVPGLKDKFKFSDKICYFSLLVLMFFSLCFSVLGIGEKLVGPVILFLFHMPGKEESFFSVAPVLMLVGLVITLIGYYMEKGTFNISEVKVASSGPVLTVYKACAKVVLYLLILLGAFIGATLLIVSSKQIFIGGTIGLIVGAVIADVIWTTVFALPRVLEKIANKKD